MSKPILCLDFDGVIHSYESGWHGNAEIILDLPVLGAFDFIRHASQYFDVMIFSSRSNLPGGIEAMKGWFRLCGGPLELVSFPAQKPTAMITIDDRAITFSGVFPQPEELLKFKPWNK